MPDTSLPLSLIAMICAVLGALMHLALARGQESERGMATLATGGALYQAGWLIWAMTQFANAGTMVWLGVFLILLGQLGLLAGTRRAFARPALLGWWAMLLPLCFIAIIASSLQLIPAPLLCQALLLAPLAFQIGREAFVRSNDEDWSLPRWLLVGTTQGLAAGLLAIGVGDALGMLDFAPAYLAVLASLTCLLLPYSYQLMIAHRLHSRLSKLVRYDALTGLLNRRGMEEHAERELHRVRKHQTSLCLMLIDIKQFRLVNQLYGYGAGDAALKKCARTLREIAGDDVLIGRIGGEEFCLVLSDKDSHALRTLAVEIEMALQSLTIEHGDHSFHLSIILSLAKYGRHGHTFEALLERAESKLQLRKATPRSEPMPDGITITP
ncbi:GGDEF domain-containing protein [Chitinibacter sp. S2-10]|uniref:GGDEF domain-containing protein n=1 Tax=Chitinibacter sp. S2-10 TaxID=3373597 RepID=UPI0039779792